MCGLSNLILSKTKTTSTATNVRIKDIDFSLLESILKHSSDNLKLVPKCNFHIVLCYACRINSQLSRRNTTERLIASCELREEVTGSNAA